MKKLLPKYFKLRKKIGNNFVYQLGFDKQEIEGILEEYSLNRVNGYLFTESGGRKILITTRKKWSAFDKFYFVLYTKNFDNIREDDFSRYDWIKHSDFSLADSYEDIRKSYNGAFTFKQENLEEGIEGLRSPQIGGIYATLAHWQISNEPATIVMPTGTGKTETMLSLLIAGNCERILIVVPSDALRSQLFKKFLNLGLLKQLSIVNKSSLYPRDCHNGEVYKVIKDRNYDIINNGEKIGTTYTINSFIDTETGKPSGKIFINSTTNENVLNRFINSVNNGDIYLSYYIKNAGNNGRFDIKSKKSNYILPEDKNGDFNNDGYYTGSMIDSKKKIYGTLRDTGNIMAGYIAGYKGFSKTLTLRATGAYNAGNNKELRALYKFIMKTEEAPFYGEDAQSSLMQGIGWELGNDYLKKQKKHH